MNKNIIKGLSLLVMSSLLLSVYLNCSGNNMEPLSSAANNNLSSSSNTDDGTCPNAATNSPTCTTNVFGNCINGASNPPTCTAGSNNSNTGVCSNGASNFPSCTLASNGSCITGANNPPECTTYNQCSNGAVNYPDCTPPSSGEFNVLFFKNGSLSEMKMQIKMDFYSADKAKKGAHFIFAQRIDPLDSSKIKTLICTNPCDDNHWKSWNPSDTTTDWSITGLKTQVGAEGLQIIYNKVGDFTPLGGYTINAGYGVGNTVREAIDEMLAYRSAKLMSGRFIEAYTIPYQYMGFTIGGPNGGSPGALATYDLWGYLFPSSEDYGKKGYFFLVAQDTNSTKLYAYKLKAEGTYEWVPWNGNASDLNDKYFKKDDSIKNESLSIFKGDATPYLNWNVFVGYGLGSTATDAANDMINKKKFNEKNPFVIK